MAVKTPLQTVTMLGLFVCLLPSIVNLSYQSGSTPRLREIFLGRCWDYQYQKFTPSSWKNCTDIWDVFHKAFSYKEPCKLNFSDYEPYFAAVGGEVAMNTVNTDVLSMF